MLASAIKYRLRSASALLLVMGLLLLGSCSSVQLAYNQLDRWMRWKLNGYVELNGTQRGRLDTAVDNFHRWHRQTQLPDYADYLLQLADEVNDTDFDRTELEAVEQQVVEFWLSSTEELCDQMLPLAAGLDSGQIEELAENMRKKRRESLEKWQKSPEKILRQRHKHIRNQGRRWLGSLSEEQEALISSWAMQVELDPILRDHQRQLWEARFIGILRRQPQGFKAELHELMINPQQIWTQDYREMQERRRQQALALGENLLASATPEQRLHLTKTLQNYAKDFRSLANR